MRKAEEYDVDIATGKTASDKYSGIKKFFNGFKNGGFSIFDFFEAAIAALIAIVLLFIFCFRVFTVSGPSMKPTLQDKDRIVVTAVGYKAQRGDIVVIAGTEADDGKPIIKRIIAVGGDKVDINFATGVVTVNGTEEHYTDELTKQQFDIAFPITVEEGTVFVLGDNRGHSIDSRSTRVGCVDEKNIVGKLLFRFFPIGNWAVE